MSNPVPPCEPRYRARPRVPIQTRMRRARSTMLPTPRTGLVLLALLACAGMTTAATGFGATSATRAPEANLLATISLSDPVALGATPPVCTDALAPLDTDDCAGASFTPGASKVLSLGPLTGTDVQAASLQWKVTTTGTSGYVVHMSNPGTSPVLRSSDGTIGDISTTNLVPATALDDGTHFGVAMGDPAGDDEDAVDYSGSPWVTSGGEQGAIFSGIPTGSGMVVARRGAAIANDPITATFAASQISGQQAAPGSYAGSVRLTASVV